MDDTYIHTSYIHTYIRTYMNTGAVNWAEVDDAYDFASRLLLQNFEAIRKPIDDSSAARRSRQRVK